MAANSTHFPVMLNNGQRGVPSPKANPHPYAIKTTSTALLSRSNSSTQSSYSSHYYVPPSPKHSGDTRHRYSRSETSLDVTTSPRPLPVPPGSRSDSEDSSEAPYLKRPSPERVNRLKAASPSPIKTDHLPPDPRTWTPSELSSYLMLALPVARPVASDIAGFIRNCRMTGRKFLRIRKSDLDV